MSLQRDHYDAIVIGSGMTGGWAARELTTQGLDTIVLEAGRPITPQADYVEHVQPWEVHFRGYGDRRKLERDQPVQRRCYACDEWSSKFFVNDRDNPYSADENKPFDWIRGRQVGGRSIMWGRQVYRWSDLDFTANAREGVGVDWPIRYADIAPWYDHVERFIGISGQAEGLPQLPDGQFLPPMEMNCAERVVRDAMARTWGRERVLTIGRCAVLTRNHMGRAACHYCGPCERGCITLSYFSSVNSTLPAAQATGRLTLRPNSVVAGLLYDPKTGRAGGVRVIDAITRESFEITGRIVFLCASALESTRILLNSADAGFPRGLGAESGALGRYIMDHIFLAGATGDIPGHERERTYGNRPNGIYVPRFRNVNDRHPGFLRGYGMQGGAGRSGWGRGNGMGGLGAAFKEDLLRNLGPWNMWLGGWGECLPRTENRVGIDPGLRDAWGIPALRIDCDWGPNELAMVEDMQVTAAEILEASGATGVRTFNSHSRPGLCIHEMGGARMGRDPATSVLNRWNQVWDVPNLFVTDGACMASSGCQNPSITYMALTARACTHAVELMKRNEL